MDCYKKETIFNCLMNDFLKTLYRAKTTESILEVSILNY